MRSVDGLPCKCPFKHNKRRTPSITLRQAGYDGTTALSHSHTRHTPQQSIAAILQLLSGALWLFCSPHGAVHCLLFVRACTSLPASSTTGLPLSSPSRPAFLTACRSPHLRSAMRVNRALVCATRHLTSSAPQCTRTARSRLSTPAAVASKRCLSSLLASASSSSASHLTPSPCAASSRSAASSLLSFSSAASSSASLSAFSRSDMPTSSLLSRDLSSSVRVISLAGPAAAPSLLASLLAGSGSSNDALTSSSSSSDADSSSHSSSSSSSASDGVCAAACRVVALGCDVSHLSLLLSPGDDGA